MKIVLKTKNDIYFLKKWIEHHSHIVGIENIVVLDNMSTLGDVLDYYDSLSDQLLVISYKGNHNRLHDPLKFPLLHAALRSSCRNYVFLDTDEYLIMVEGSQYFSDARIVQYVVEEGAQTALPTIWIYNATGSEDIFVCGKDDKALRDGLLFGKPVMPSLFDVKGFFNHNCQVLPTCFQLVSPIRLIVLHMTQLSIQQRVTANIEKLISRGIMIDHTSLSDVLATDFTTHPDPNVAYYIQEIRERLHHPADFETVDELLTGTFCMEKTGMLRFYSKFEACLIETFTQDFDRVRFLLKEGFSPVELPED